MPKPAMTKAEQLRKLREESIQNPTPREPPLMRVYAAAALCQNSESALAAAITNASSEGHSMRQIALAAGMSHPAVSAILKRAEAS